MVRWWLFEEPLVTLGIYGQKQYWPLALLVCWFSNFDVLLLLDWLIADDDSLNSRWWDLDDFDANIKDKKFLVLISETLMFHYRLVDGLLMMLWRDIVETLKIANETFVIFFCCVNIWIIGLSLLVHWRVVDDVLKKHWWHYGIWDANNKDHWSF